VPGPGEELITVSSAALNPHDQVVAAGINVAAPYPYVTGIEGVGRTEDGRRVYVAPTNPPNGSLAEYTVISASRAIPIPDRLTDEQALGIGMAGMTAWLALVWKGQLEAGQSVLVTAATGAVGQIAATRRNGRVVNFGMRAGRTATISGVELKGRELIGFATTDADPERIRQAYERMVEHVLDGTLVVAAESMHMQDIAVAWQRQRDSPNTKLVLTV